MLPVARLWFACAALACAAGCSSSDSPGAASAPSGSPDAGGDGPAAAACAKDPRAMAWAPDLSVAGASGQVKVTITAAQPSPPTKGANAWTVAVADAGGQPISGAAFTVKPFMVDHNHGAPVDPQVAPSSTPGSYDVTDMDLFMPGVWQLTFDFTAPAKDKVVFTLCIDG